MFLLRNGSHHVLVETGRQTVGFDIRDKTVTVFLTDEGFDFFGFAGHDIPFRT
jgi:hypothetical protein